MQQWRVGWWGVGLVCTSFVCANVSFCGRVIVALWMLAYCCLVCVDSQLRTSRCRTYLFGPPPPEKRSHATIRKNFVLPPGRQSSGHRYWLRARGRFSCIGLALIVCYARRSAQDERLCARAVSNEVVFYSGASPAGPPIAKLREPGVTDFELSRAASPPYRVATFVPAKGSSPGT